MTYIADSLYPAPVYLARNQVASGNQGNILDIAACNASRQPPVIIGTLGGGTMTVVIEGSHDAVNFVDFSSGGLTADFDKDLVQGVRFWRVRVTAYTSGAFNASVGAVPDKEGRAVIPNLKQYSNNVPTSAGG
jgi:hypothetical protein